MSGPRERTSRVLYPQYNPYYTPEFAGAEGQVQVLAYPNTLALGQTIEARLHNFSVNVKYNFSDLMLMKLDEKGEAQHMVGKTLAREIARYVEQYVEKQLETIFAKMEANSKKTSSHGLMFSPGPFAGVPGPGRHFIEEIKRLFPNASAQVPWPCACDHGYSSAELTSVVMHLNDKCGWSREQIADWMETLDVDLTLNTQPPVSGPDHELIAKNLMNGLVLTDEQIKAFVEDLKKDQEAQPVQAVQVPPPPMEKPKMDGLDALAFSLTQFPVVNDPKKFGNINPT